MPLQVKSLAEWEREGIADMLSVVIPAHNEEHQIADTVEGIAEALQDANIPHEILVVNDNSVDPDGDDCPGSRSAEPRGAVRQQRPTKWFRLCSGPGPRRVPGRRGRDPYGGWVGFAGRPRSVLSQTAGRYDCVFGSRFRRGGRWWTIHARNWS
jgi:dolichol-phosphate mannosyltransferase